MKSLSKSLSKLVYDRQSLSKLLKFINDMCKSTLRILDSYPKLLALIYVHTRTLGVAFDTVREKHRYLFQRFLHLCVWKMCREWSFTQVPAPRAQWDPRDQRAWTGPRRAGKCTRILTCTHNLTMQPSMHSKHAMFTAHCNAAQILPRNRCFSIQIIPVHLTCVNVHAFLFIASVACAPVPP